MNKQKSNQKQLFELIRVFAGKGNIISVARPFIDFMGSIEGGLFLSQIVYWSDKGARHQNGWIYKTYLDWFEEVRLSEYQIRKAIKICEQKGFLETKVKKANGNPTLHYKFHTKRFTDLFRDFFMPDGGAFDEPLDQITEEARQDRYDEAEQAYWARIAGLAEHNQSILSDQPAEANSVSPG